MDEPEAPLSFDACLAKTTLQESSKKTYKAFWNRLRSKLYAGTHPTKSDIIRDQLKIYDYIIKNEKQPQSKLRMITTPIVKSGIDLPLIAKCLSDLRRDEMQHQEPKTRPKTKDGKEWHWHMVNDLYHTLIQNQKKTDDEWKALVILAIAVEIAPQRANELRLLTWDKNVDFTKGTLTIIENKTNRPAQSFKMSSQLINILKDYRSTLSPDCTYMFVTKTNQPYRERGGGFQKVLTRLCGLTIHQLRHLYVSDYLPTCSAKDKNQAAKRMFHNAATQALVYTAMEKM